MNYKEKFGNLSKKQAFLLEYDLNEKINIKKLVYIKKIYKNKILCFEKIDSFLKTFLLINKNNIKTLILYDKNIHRL